MTSPRPLLRVGAVERPPWTVFINDTKNGLDVGGVMGDFLKILAEYMNFDYEIVPPPNNLAGYQLNNGSWVGMIGLIERGELDFTLHGFTLSPTIWKVADFTIPLIQDNKAILTPRPKIAYDIQGVFKPFSLEVWLCTLISLVAISVAIILTEKVESELFGFKISDLTAKSLMWSTKALTQEGSVWLPSADGGRLIVTTWLLSSLIFMSCFSGILTAMLTVPKVTIPVDSLEDLVSQSKIPWKIVSRAFVMRFLQQSEAIVHQKTYAGMAGTISSISIAKYELVRGDYATINDENLLKVVMNWDYSTHGVCNLYMAKEYVYSNTIHAMAFKKNSIYMEKTNRIIASLKESGISNHWIDRLFVNATHCLKSPVHDRAAGIILPLSLEAFWGSFILLLVGSSIASTVFLFEKLQ